MQPVNAPAGGRSGHDGQNQHAENIVEDGRPENDSGGPGREDIHVRKRTGGNSNAGGHHGGSNEHCFNGGVAAQLHVREAQHKRSDNAENGDEQRLATDSDQVSRAGLKTGAEKNENRSDLSDGTKSVGGGDPAQSVRTEKDSGQNLSWNCGQAEALEDFAQHFRGHENDKKFEQQLFGPGWECGRHSYLDRSIWEGRTARNKTRELDLRRDAATRAACQALSGAKVAKKTDHHEGH